MNFDQSDLPNIPGFRVSVDTRDKFHKSHKFDIKNGIPVTDIDPMSAIASQAKVAPAQVNKKKNINKIELESSSATSSLPRWVVYDRKVLRFYAYFTEEVFNSAIEKQRVRQCVIYYYLADDSLMITEIRKENSGIPQSVFLKRQTVDVNYLDMKVGQKIVVYNRSFFVVDADEATRKYFKSQHNIALQEAISFPKDDYIKYLEKRENQCKASQNEANDVKSYVEAILGRISSERLAKSKKYLANDGKVLRFSGVWRDTSWGGSNRNYIILYFLCDDSIQVLEKNQDGKVVPLLKRDNLPKKYLAAGCNVGVNPSSASLYNHGDLRIGSYLNVYGRQVLITACDDFTKEFYKKVHHFKDSDFVAIGQKKAAPEEMKKEREIPKYNGFGSEEDSLGSWKSLVPKPPVKDHQKLTKYDGCQLRFLAKFTEKNTDSENYERRFLILFFLTDDTIQIYERPLRNSGFLSGKFLQRTKLKNKANNDQWFHAEDFYIGATVLINGFHFDLIETDKQTTDIMSNNLEVFTRDEPEKILAALADKLWDRSFNKTKTYRFIDEDKDRYISPPEMKSLCAKYGWNLNPKQTKILFRYFDTDDSGEISVDEFFKAISKFKLQKHIHPDTKEKQRCNN